MLKSSSISEGEDNISAPNSPKGRNYAVMFPETFEPRPDTPKASSSQFDINSNNAYEYYMRDEDHELMIPKRPKLKEEIK